MHVHEEIRRLAADQDDVVAAWQLRAAGLDRIAASRALRGGQPIHDGVVGCGFASLTRQQRLRAATLTAPETFLAGMSSGHHFGLCRSVDPSFEVVVRPGPCGKRRVDGLLVVRSTCLEGHVTEHLGIPTTTAERTLLDLTPYLDDQALTRALLNGLRLEVVTWQGLRHTIAAHRGRRGIARFRACAEEYGGIPIAGNKSLSESLATVILRRVGLVPSRHNDGVAGLEADLIFDDLRLIVEIDGGPWHHPALDAIKDAAWELAGWTVVRVDADDVWDRPERLIAAVNMHRST